MKEQLKDMQAYQAGLSPEGLKDKYNLDVDLFKLASNENVYGPSPKVKEAIQENLDRIFYYPETDVPQVREALSEFYNINPKTLFFGAGLDEAILTITRTELDDGDKIVTSEATFGQYKRNAIVEGAEVVEVPLKDGYFDLDGILNEIDDKTKMVWICNPNNPTGTYVTHEALENFISQVPDDVLVMVDEAYFEFVNQEDYPNTFELQDKYQNVVLLRTFSKAYGLAGLRIGYVIADESHVNNWDIIRPPFDIGVLTQVAAQAALEDQDYLKDVTSKVVTEREKFYELEASKHFYDSETNFIYVKTDRPHDLYEALLEVGAITREFPDGLRISIGFEDQNDKVRRVLESFEF
ncbi:histidinol-phosphate transaminase [Staphylococcus massiliensis]|uniref:histidinol-phosphate transaminase n=1 Tax=Staphylococcus massiliensis TaxID=555791 RepID=UPI00030929B3|nr:histidinol-phosphate transaminase [Staphylococcus massiliensis]MCG3400096.1 histidinol-phosphate transaminase [Staphylococcus massiliensis]MCG3401818.1 histidinol-phosphate transaminase [Staphylococcus massiliensis]MCG3413151.1 histidinol-phosphate transaminase [Staphylococcus massiliensis]PNZ97566.1 histidinol-phosphate transaminase [Staphylococcus massiliensis CCUG 55927]